MNAVVLAAGYGTRLTRDIEADTTGAFDHLRGLPKPLLPIGGVQLVSRWMHEFARSKHITGSCIIVRIVLLVVFESYAKDQCQQSSVVHPVGCRVSFRQTCLRRQHDERGE